MSRIAFGGHSLPLIAGKTIFDYADELQVRVPTSCGRTGLCHECIVEVKAGQENLGAPTEPEAFLRGDYRLACQAVIKHSDEDIEFSLLHANQKILSSRPPKDVSLDPAVRRDGDNVIHGEQVIDKYRGRMYGVAVDLGTTTVVAELVDLETGESNYLASFENPQRFGGSDVMHRISYDSGPFHGELHNAVINTLNQELREMCRRLALRRQMIYEISVVGNSTMRELFFNLDVKSIGQRPYKSPVEHEYLAGDRETTALVEDARKLRLWAHPRAKVYAAPLIASHVGADMAAALVAVNIELQSESVMIVDIGTNTEVVVAHEGRLMAASCPAGPAFEGGGIRYGMTAVDGAIETLHFNGDAQYETIGGGEPRGLCGSGLIDLLAELRRYERMSPKGVFADKSQEISIVPERGITFSREDASNLAQAKAANYCGQFIVMRKLGLQPSDIGKLYLAGGFANYVDVANAIEIGFLASVREERVVKTGNAALQGAKELLLSTSKRESLDRMVKRVEHVELETTPDFFEVFVEGCQFKPMPADLNLLGE
ncbi:MAG: ASKHA domain-containing protein [Bryobacterales bacterium]|nr:ASKHA domain-containing protein [Bryobacterales bacterium]